MTTHSPRRHLTRSEIRRRYPPHAPTSPAAPRVTVVCCEREATEPEGAGHDLGCPRRSPNRH